MSGTIPAVPHPQQKTIKAQESEFTSDDLGLFVLRKEWAQQDSNL
ncbi:hypothetical protein [Streptomyces endophytica]|uniref:Uncharacterized protein n=1 Tax=Streptomyces endophytica TaxID=2991496 RepID=A0ABY6PCQ6_9ACTN|nr:hypothetical protein [Streptomyces endophytica]UZJ31566.1 hypothetical protein OJ254_16275 [Streptomyces endophytica]